MNTGKQIYLMVVLVFLLLAGCGAYALWEPTRQEHAAQWTLDLTAARGAEIFAQNCRNCHGDGGEGRIGPQLNTAKLRPTDPTDLGLMQQFITNTVSCGRIGAIMPPWLIQNGGSLDEEQIREVMTLVTTNAGNAWANAKQQSLRLNEGQNLSSAAGGWLGQLFLRADPNKLFALPAVEDVLAAASVTGETASVCGQKPLATPTASGTPSASPTAQASGPATTSPTVVAGDNFFKEKTITVPVGQPVTLTFKNDGQAVHTWTLIDPKGFTGTTDTSIVNGGGTKTITFTASQPGTYQFHCTVHPTEMTGQLIVVPAGGSQAGGATPTVTATPGPGGAAATSVTEDMGDNFFKSKTLTVAADKPITVTVKNEGQAVHTWTVLDATGASGQKIDSGILQPGDTKTVTFTITKPGTYKFDCSVHPTEMTGTLVVK